MIDHEDIIVWAQEAHGPITGQWWDMDVTALERFAKLAYAAGAKDAQEFCIRIYHNATALADDAIRNREQYE